MRRIPDTSPDITAPAEDAVSPRDEGALSSGGSPGVPVRVPRLVDPSVDGIPHVKTVIKNNTKLLHQTFKLYANTFLNKIDIYCYH